MLTLFFQEINPEVNFIFKQENPKNSLQILIIEAGEKAGLCKYIKKSIFSMLWPGSTRDSQNINATGDN